MLVPASASRLPPPPILPGTMHKSMPTTNPLKHSGGVQHSQVREGRQNMAASHATPAAQRTANRQSASLSLKSKPKLVFLHYLSKESFKERKGFILRSPLLVLQLSFCCSATTFPTGLQSLISFWKQKAHIFCSSLNHKIFACTCEACSPNANY